MPGPQLVAIADAPTAHLCGPPADLLFADLADEARGRVLPLARFDGRELGLDVPWVPLVYHETWHLETVEIVPVGERFVLAPALWWEITTPGVSEHLARIGHFAFVPFGRGKITAAEAESSAAAYRHALSRATLRELNARGIDPIVGRTGSLAEPAAIDGVRGELVLHLDAGKIGLADVSFLIYWDGEARRFVQVLRIP